MSGEDYSDESALEALDHLQNEILPYINVPVKAARSLLTGDGDKKGFVDIGYLISYDAANDVIRIGVYNKYSDFIENNDLSIKLNVIAKDNVLTKFTTFEVVTRNSGMWFNEYIWGRFKPPPYPFIIIYYLHA